MSALPAVAVQEGGRFHVLATPSGQAAARDFLVDGQGAPAAAGALPLAQIDAAVACGGGLVVAGRRAETASPEILALEPDGRVAWRQALPTSEPVRWLKLLCPAGHVEVVWLGTRDRATLWWARLARGQPPSPLASLRGREIVEADAVTVGDAAVLLASGREEAELVRLVDGRPAERTTSRGKLHGPAVAIVGDRCAAVWLSDDGRQVVGRWFDRALSPLAPPAALLTVDEHRSFLGARLVAGEPARLALVAGRRIEGPGLATRRGPVRHIAPLSSEETVVAACDPLTSALGPQHVLAGGPALAAAGWQGNTLFIVHGHDPAHITPLSALLHGPPPRPAQPR